MSEFILSPQLDKKLQKLSEKDRVQYEILLSKIEEIMSSADVS